MECGTESDVNIRSSKFLETPSHFAAFGDHPHCLHWLLQMGADIDSQVMANGLTAFSFKGGGVGWW